MFRKLIYTFFVLAHLGAAVPAQATLITFVYSETDAVDTASGSFTFDDIVLDGSSSQVIAHSTITAFTFVLNAQSWGLSDLIMSSSFVFDSSGAMPDVVGANGNTANNGSSALSFEGLGAGQARCTPLCGFISIDEGDWNLDAANPVPEPSTLLVLGFGFAGLGFFRRRRKAA